MTSALPHLLLADAIAMLRHADACARNDERGRRGNVERAGAIAAGAARVEHRQRRLRSRTVPPFPHHPRERRQFQRGLSLHSQRREESGDLSVRCAAGHEFFHGMTRFLLRSD